MFHLELLIMTGIIFISSIVFLIAHRRYPPSPEELDMTKDQWIEKAREALAHWERLESHRVEGGAPSSYRLRVLTKDLLATKTLRDDQNLTNSLPPRSNKES